MLKSASRAIPPRRSIMFMPASKQRFLDKAKTLAADGIIFDLEDAVPLTEKEMGREMAVNAINSGEYPGKEKILRVNQIGTPWFDKDLAEGCASSADALLLPKVTSREDLDAVVNTMHSREMPIKPFWCMIETPSGVLNAFDIASHPNCDCLVVGTEDLKNELQCAPVATPPRYHLQFALQASVMAARAAQVTIIDGVYTDLKNLEGFTVECEQGKDLGFDGKTLLHPTTIATANQIFAPSPAEVDEARELLAYFHSTQESSGVGAITFKGKLVEDLHIERAQRILYMQEKIDARSV